MYVLNAIFLVANLAALQMYVKPAILYIILSINKHVIANLHY